MVNIRIINRALRSGAVKSVIFAILEEIVIGLIRHDPTLVTTYPLEYHFTNEITDCSQDKTANLKKIEPVKF